MRNIKVAVFLDINRAFDTLITTCMYCMVFINLGFIGG